MLAKVLVAIDALDFGSPRLLECAHSLARTVDALALNYTLALAAQLNWGVSTLYLTCQTNLISKRASAPSLASLLCALSAGYDAVLVSGATYWHDIMARASAVLNKPVVSNVCKPLAAGLGEFVRSVYAGRLMQHIRCEYVRPWLLSINTASFSARSFNLFGARLQLVQHTIAQCCKPLKRELPETAGLPALCDAKIVIAGGSAFGSAEMFSKYLQPLAAKLGAAIGASRAAVDAGFAPAECQIGQSGKVIAPKLYLAFGISGSDHHMVGVRDSGVILAVNINSDAPITKLADYTIVANMFEIIPRLLALLPFRNKTGTSVDGRPLTPCAYRGSVCLPRQRALIR